MKFAFFRIAVFSYLFNIMLFQMIAVLEIGISVLSPIKTALYKFGVQLELDCKTEEIKA